MSFALITEPISVPPALWIGFSVVVVLLLLIDLNLFHNKAREASLTEALLATLGWIALATGFGLWITFRAGTAKGLEFFSGYLIEYALSMDNIFLFVLIFQSFKINSHQQHQLLFWGVFGALVMRAIMIFAGVGLIQNFSWIMYLFGAYIVYAGIEMLLPKHGEQDVEDSIMVRLARRFLPMATQPTPGRYFLREKGHLKFTLLALVLVVIEGTDLLFALDSIPAVFGITTDAFIVFTSNVAAVLGLRSLYFLLAGAIRYLTYLHYGLALILIFIGAKMVLADLLPISTLLSLAVVGGILNLTVLISLFYHPKKNDRKKRSH